MGTTLTGKRVQNTYDSLLKLSDNDNLTGSPKIVGSGLGTDSPIYLSTTSVGIGISPSVQFQTSGNAQIGNNLVVGGNLTVNGTTTIVDSTIIAIGDNMIELAKDNTANTKDIGWYGTIVESGTKFAGMYYDASTGVTNPEFHIGVGTVEPGSTAAWTTKGKLVIGALDATTGVFNGNVDIIGSLKTDSNIEIQAASGYGFMEIGGPSGGHIDLKKPFSDDYDLRLITGTDSEITASGTLKLNAGNTLTLTLNGSTQAATFASSVTAGSFIKSGGTSAQYLMADGSVSTGGFVDGSGTANDVVMWQDSDTLTDAPIAISGTKSIFGGDIEVSPSVNKRIRFMDGATFKGGIQLVDTGGQMIGSSAANDLAIRSQSNMIFSTGGNTERFRIASSTGLATFENDIMAKGNFLNVAQYIIHINDGDTYHRFLDDRQLFVAGNIEFIDFAETTQNYITLGNSSDVDAKLQGGSGFIFIQGSDGYIGINDLTPTSPFDINGNTAITGTLNITSTISSKEISIKQQDDSGFDAGLTIERSANTQKVHIGMDGGAVNFNSPDGLSYKFRNNGTEKFTISPSGNLSPAGVILFNDGNGINFGNSNAKIYGSSASGIQFNAGGSEAMRLNQSGNLGIGTTSPFNGAELDVFGDIALIHQNWALRGNNGNSDFAIEELAGSNFSDALIKFYIKSGGNIGIGTTAPSQILHLEKADDPMLLITRGGSNRAILGDTGSNNGGDLLLYNSSGTNTARIRAGEVSYLTGGNVGIGLTGPAHLLHVQGDATDGVLVVSRTSNTDQKLFLRGGAGSGEGRVASNYHLELKSGLSGSNAYDLSLSTSTGVALRVDATNNYIGIGTTSPFAPLTVVATGIGSNGTIGIQGANAHVGFKNSSGTFRSWVGHFNATGHGSDADLNLKTGYGTTGNIRFTADGDTTAAQMFLQGSSGRLGIGTTSPTGKLDVESTSTSTAPVIEITNTSSITYNHSINAFAPNLTANENNIFIIGKSGSTKNSGYIGYKWKADADNSNVLTFGHWASNNLMNLTGDGRLGIGTESPQSALEVVDSTNYKGIHIRGNAAPNLTFGQNLDTTAEWKIGISGFNGDSFSIGTGTGANDLIHITSVGDVGIGTTSPAQKLEIVDSGFAYTRLRSTASSYTGFDIGQHTGGSVFLNNRDNKSIIFMTNNTQRMTISAGGNVGIGETSPSKKLVLSENDNECVMIIKSSDTGTAGIYMGDQSDEIVGGIIYDNNNDLLQLRSSNNHTAISIDSSERVGIGTTSPSTKLHIVGSNGAVTPSTFSVFDLTVADASEAAIGILGTNFSSIYFGDAANPNQGAIVYNHISDSMDFRTAGNVERMRITSGGVVGIGTSSPNAGVRLEVNGIISANGDQNPTGGGLGFGDYQTAGYKWIQSFESQELRINPLGNNVLFPASSVAIGTTSTAAGSQLTVNASSSAGITISTGSNAGECFINFADAADANVGQIFYGHTDNKMVFRVNDDSRMTINSSGNVGIATTSPGSKLHVKGGSTSTQSTFSNFISNSTFRSVVNHNNEYGLYMGYANATTDTSAIQSGRSNGTVDKLALNPYGGNVGVGTSAPEQKLHIEGSTAIVRVKSTTNNQNASIWFNSNQGGTQADRWEIGTNISAGADLEFFDRLNSQSRMVIQNDGKVGIQTISPDSRLQITNYDGSSYRFGYGGSSDVYFDMRDFYIRSANGGTNIARFQQNGKVGIGTTSPSA
jgi:hypothetical protein